MSGVTALLSDPASAGVWNLVPERSTIAFKGTSMWGLLPVKGRFNEFSGDGQITDAGTVFGRVDVKTASLDTKLRKRDKDLRAPEFFDVTKYPGLSVVVTGGNPAGDDTVDLRADLTVKGSTAPLPLQAKVTVLDDGTVRLITATTVDRKQIGVDGNMLGMIKDKVTISADVVFRRAGTS
jgi:polyisoprenoid-binding protein YceI